MKIKSEISMFVNGLFNLVITYGSLYCIIMIVSYIYLFIDNYFLTGSIQKEKIYGFIIHITPLILIFGADLDLLLILILVILLIIGIKRKKKMDKYAEMKINDKK